MPRKNKVYVYKDLAPKDSCYDETTGHVFVDNGDSVIEMKYCTKCKSWHPVSSFYSTKRTKDGLTSCCMSCRRLESLKYNVKKNKQLSGKAVTIKKKQKKNRKKETSVDEISNMLNEYFGILAEEYKEQITQLEQKVTDLEKELSQRFNPNQMTDAEFERMIMSRKGVQPRVYFNAIKKLDIDNKYTIKVYDSSTGLTTVVKTDAA